MDLTIPIVLLLAFVGAFGSGFLIHKSYSPSEDEANNAK